MRVERVTVQLRAPAGTDLGQVTEGFYTVTGGVLTMCRADGGALVDRDGNSVGKPHSLGPNDSAEAIARVLTKQVRRQLLGITETEERFGRRLNYLPVGVA